MPLIPLKEGHVFARLSDCGRAGEGTEGFYYFDTRHLRRWCWRIDRLAPMMTASPRADRLVQIFGAFDAARRRTLGVTRRIQLRPNGFRDELIVSNDGPDESTISMRLEAAADFVDIFATYEGGGPDAALEPEDGGRVWRARHRDEDGIECDLALTLDPPAPGLAWTIALAPQNRFSVSIDATFRSTLPDAQALDPLPSYESWRNLFRSGADVPEARAIDDLRALLLPTRGGLLIAAGVPSFVAPFGRDALIAAIMLLPEAPALAGGVLTFLSQHIGKTVSPERQEEPGRILHEWRWGALCRTGRLPYGRFYASIDSTPLYLWLLADYVRATGERGFFETLRPAWEAALQWLYRRLDGGGGLIFFSGGGGVLKGQSWKDADTAMHYEDGRDAAPPLAVIEVQAYAAAALKAMSEILSAHGDTSAGAKAESFAAGLRERIQDSFWCPGLRSYALALDRDGKPLQVLASNPGHALWCGIVPRDLAPILSETLLSDSMWSGWGLRTLGSRERNYNPVSYHDGSVWPHDTAIFGAGLFAYGYHDQGDHVAAALTELSLATPDRRLPELICGFAREPDVPPVFFPGACRPQAWAAAALPFLGRLQRRARA